MALHFVYIQGGDWVEDVCGTGKGSAIPLATIESPHLDRE